jgi:ketosteroid isomerase-like protein
MAEEAIDVIGAMYAAWNAGDWGEERMHPDLEWEIAGKGAIDQSGPAQGRDGLLAYWRRFWGAWQPGGRWELDELRELDGGQILACGTLHAVGRSSGVESATRVAHLWCVRDGVIVRLFAGDDRAQALEAAGR